MVKYEYKVIPAPRRGVRTKGAKGTAGRFASALEAAINEISADGWEYVRAESLPADERHGITRRKTETYQNVLIFRRIAEPKTLPPVLLEHQIMTDDDSDDTSDEITNGVDDKKD